MTIFTSSAKATALATAQTSDNPFVSFDNLAASATLGGTATLADGAAANAVNGSTYDYWRPNVTGTTAQFRVTFASAVTIGFVGLAAHNIFTLGGSVAVQRSTDGGTTWLTSGITSSTPADNSAIGIRLIDTGQNAADWRVNITGLTIGAPLYVGTIHMGPEVVFPRRFYRDFAPVITPTEVQLQSNVSVGGNLLGTSVIASGSTLAAQFQNLTPAFVRNTLPPFQAHFNRGRPFFFAWRPTTYPGDLHYCWRDGDTMRPINSGPRDFMSVSMAMRVFEA